MSTAALKRMPKTFGPGDNGILMRPREFDTADFQEGWRYELINGVLIVSPLPSESEVDPNEELGYWLRHYQETHPEGSALNLTLPERIVRTGRNRRRADRLIWAGLGRRPRKGEHPTIVAEFVSGRKRDRERDYETKRVEYMKIKVIQEYWIIDRFDRCLVVFFRQGGKIRRRIIAADESYRTPVLPGFELPVGKLLALADRWGNDEEDVS
jgi:Uma2 family endonuclease